MKQINVLSKTEMMAVSGGIISKETLYDMCMDNIANGYTGDAEVDAVWESFGENYCTNWVLGVN